MKERAARLSGSRLMPPGYSRPYNEEALRPKGVRNSSADLADPAAAGGLPEAVHLQGPGKLTGCGVSAG